jgi:hypothetical protein
MVRLLSGYDAESRSQLSTIHILEDHAICATTAIEKKVFVMLQNYLAGATSLFESRLVIAHTQR